MLDPEIEKFFEKILYNLWSWPPFHWRQTRYGCFDLVVPLLIILFVVSVWFICNYYINCYC